MLFLFAGTLVGLASCSKDVNEDDDCLRPGYKSTLTLNMNVHDSLISYKDISVADPIAAATRATRDGIPQLQYCAWIYRQDDKGNVSYDKPVVSFQTMSATEQVKLEPGKYRLITWANYLVENHSYFHTDDVHDMLLTDYYNYPGADPKKHAFLSAKDITVTYRDHKEEMQLEGIMAQYRILPTDTANYEIGYVEIYYPEGLPCSNDITVDEICHEWRNVAFDADPSNISDYVMADKGEKNLTIALAVYDKSGVLRARRKAVTFPIKRGGITNVKLNLFTIREGEPVNEPTKPGNGGIGIQEDFEYTYWIEV